MMRAAALGHQVWIEARANDDFAPSSRPSSATSTSSGATSSASSGTTRRTQPLLDDFEPFMKTSEVAEVFDTIRPSSRSSSARRRTSTPRSSTSRTRAELQREFGERILATLGLEDGAWRLDPTVHPFCTSFSTRDVRLTTRYNETGLDSLWSTMHEAGHGHYAHGISPLARAHPARDGAVARPERVAEPHLGEPRRAQPPVLVALVRAAPGRRSRPSSATSTSKRSSPRSTAPSRASSASRRTRRHTAFTSSCASSSSSS